MIKGPEEGSSAASSRGCSAEPLHTALSAGNLFLACLLAGCYDMGFHCFSVFFAGFL